MCATNGRTKVESPGVGCMKQFRPQGSITDSPNFSGSIVGATGTGVRACTANELVKNECGREDFKARTVGRAETGHTIEIAAKSVKKIVERFAGRHRIVS